LPNGGSLGGASLDPPIGFYGWLTPDPRIFMSPWYQLVLIKFEPTNKLPYRKLQYPTYVKDINLMLTLEFLEGN
jgi:hypothetical protein